LNNASTPQFVFAPTNEAIEKLKTDLGSNADAVLNNKTIMGDVLKYHVVQGASLNTTRLSQLVEMSGKGVVPFTTLEGEKVNVTAEAPTQARKLMQGAAETLFVNGVKLASTNLQGGKTIYHAIGEVLVPPQYKTAVQDAIAAAAASPSPEPAAEASPSPAPEASPAPPKSSAAGVAASLVLAAMPAVLAALL